MSGNRAALALALLWAAALPGEPAADRDAGKPDWVDVTAEAGLAWGPTRIAAGSWNLVETMGGGGAFLDYDRDGWLDIFFVSYSLEPQADGRVPRDALYRNLGDGRFEDVTASAGLGGPMRGMGAAVADYDADGWPDVYVSGYRGHRLYRNAGGRFVDATAEAGLGEEPHWGTSAAFFDADADGDLDLFVARYLDVDPDGPVPCQMIEDRPFCAIKRFSGSPSALYRNQGDGTFIEVGEAAGIALAEGKGLGVAVADLDGDGLTDVFEANDTSPNHLFRSLGDGRFEDVALLADVAYDASGRARGAMGVDVADVDGDGLPEVFVTNFNNEANSFFRNRGQAPFDDDAHAAGLAAPSLPMSGFGTRFLDEDNDGHLDIAVANGHPFEPVARVWPGVTFAEPAFLFEGSTGGFRLARGTRVAALAAPLVGRGLATGDYDNDGDTDLLLLAAGERPRLLRNDGGNRNGWLGLRLVGSGPNRDAIGAVVSVTTAAGSSLRLRAGGTSYLSSSDPRILVGLGAAPRVESVEVRWPDGTRTVLAGTEPGRYVTVRQQDGGGGR